MNCMKLSLYMAQCDYNVPLVVKVVSSVPDGSSYFSFSLSLYLPSLTSQNSIISKVLKSCFTTWAKTFDRKCCLSQEVGVWEHILFIDHKAQKGKFRLVHSKGYRLCWGFPHWVQTVITCSRQNNWTVHTVTQWLSSHSTDFLLSIPTA